jgi:carboxyl-terminal processing protease
MNSRLKAVVVTISACFAAVVLTGAMLVRSAPPDGAYRQLAVYTDVLARIKSDYVEEPNIANVTLGALTGLLESIDPFASYLNAEQYKEYLKNHDAFRGSVGLSLSKRYGYIGVVDVVPGSPAAKAGLTTHDMIEAIKDVSTRDMPLAYADLLLHGKPGTTIELSVLTMRQPEPKKITLTRVALQYPPVTSKMLPDQIGYIEVESLVPGKAGEVAAALAELNRQDPKYLILDLRHCSTGPPEEGLILANLFLDKGLLAYLQGQRVPRRNFEADPSKPASRLPLVVITNRGTAGGAEVATAALLDNKRAEVVGERTYGDAALRRTLTMDDGSAIILSVAKYYSPGGKAIQDTAVTPSVPVAELEPVEEFDEENPPEPPARPSEDNLLKKAIEVLLQGAPPTAKTPPKAAQPTGVPREPPRMPPNIVRPK